MYYVVGYKEYFKESEKVKLDMLFSWNTLTIVRLFTEKLGRTHFYPSFVKSLIFHQSYMPNYLIHTKYTFQKLCAP